MNFSLNSFLVKSLPSLPIWFHNKNSAFLFANETIVNLRSRQLKTYEMDIKSQGNSL